MRHLAGAVMRSPGPSDAIAAKSSTIFPDAIAATVPPSVFRFSPEMYDAASLLRKIKGHACSAECRAPPGPCARSMSFPDPPCSRTPASWACRSVGADAVQPDVLRGEVVARRHIVQMMIASFDCAYRRRSPPVRVEPCLHGREVGRLHEGSHFSMLGGTSPAVDEITLAIAPPSVMWNDQRGEVTGGGKVERAPHRGPRTAHRADLHS